MASPREQDGVGTVARDRGATAPSFGAIGATVTAALRMGDVSTTSRLLSSTSAVMTTSGSAPRKRTRSTSTHTTRRVVRDEVPTRSAKRRLADPSLRMEQTQQALTTRQTELQQQVASLLEQVTRTTRINDMLKSEVLTLFSRTRMLECTVEACESLLQAHVERHDASDRKFVGLDHQVASVLSAAQRLNTRLTDEVNRQAVVTQGMTTDHQLLKKWMYDRVLEVRHECVGAIRRMKQHVEETQRDPSPCRTLQQPKLSATDRTKPLEASVQLPGGPDPEDKPNRQYPVAVESTLQQHIQEVVAAELLKQRTAYDETQKKWMIDQQDACNELINRHRDECDDAVSRMEAQLHAKGKAEQELRDELAACRSELEEQRVVGRKRDESLQKLEARVDHEYATCTIRHVGVLTTIKAILETSS